MNEIPYNSGSAYAQAPVQATPPRAYSTVECVFAWLCLLSGYVFCRVFPAAVHPLGGLLFIVALFAVTTVMLKLKGVSFGVLPLTAMASAVAVSASLILCANTLIHTVAYAYALAAYGYFLYASTGNTLENGFSDLMVIDFLKALVILPFCSFDHLFSAMFSGKAKNGGHVLLKLLGGIAIAVIPTALVLSLLSYDSGFSELLDKIFDVDFGDIFSHLFSVALGIPIGMYIFGLFISSADRKAGDILTAEQCRAASQKMKIVPMLTALAAVVPLLCIYSIFFVSQWQYYVSGFTGVLPDGFSYAEYAREGFFQLCAVSVINLIVIVMVMLFMRRAENKPPVVLKALAVIYAVFTLVLISTALAKMWMYIDYYGLTPKRVYATWFMLMLALVFLIILVKQFAPKLKAVALSVCVCVACFAGLALSGVDGWIAQYNVQRYFDGTLNTVDVQAMYELGDAAIPSLARVYESLDEDYQNDRLNTNAKRRLYTQVKAQLQVAATEKKTDEAGMFSLTIPAIKAENALEEIGMM